MDAALNPAQRVLGHSSKAVLPWEQQLPLELSEVEKDPAENIADVVLQLTQVCVKQRMKLKIVCPLERNKTSKQESSPEVAL